MAKWEYLSVWIRDDSEGPGVEKLGRKGWEAYAATTEKWEHNGSSYAATTHYMKRRIHKRRRSQALPPQEALKDSLETVQETPK